MIPTEFYDWDKLFQVDAHVSKHLFNECIKRHLCGKTIILATHQLQYIKDVDAIILFEQGKAKYFSKYQDLLRVHPEYNVHIAEEISEEKRFSTVISRVTINVV